MQISQQGKGDGFFEMNIFWSAQYNVPIGVRLYTLDKIGVQSTSSGN
jgi:hypothetical protein